MEVHIVERYSASYLRDLHWWSGGFPIHCSCTLVKLLNPLIINPASRFRISVHCFCIPAQDPCPLVPRFRIFVHCFCTQVQYLGPLILYPGSGSLFIVSVPGFRICPLILYPGSRYLSIVPVPWFKTSAHCSHTLVRDPCSLSLYPGSGYLSIVSVPRFRIFVH